MKKFVERVTDTAVTFKSGIEVRVVVASEMAVSATYAMIVLDEAARLPGAEAAVPDKAMIATLMPGLAPITGAPRRKFVAITSAFIDAPGWAFETDRDNFGREDADTLVLRGSTELFNPNIDRAWLERERRKDPHGRRSRVWRGRHAARVDAVAHRVLVRRGRYQEVHRPR